MFFLPALVLTAIAILCVLVPLSRHVPAGLNAWQTPRRRLAALAALFFIPLFSFGLYFKVGHPELPDMPLAARRAASLDNADFSTLIARIEDHLRQDKNDIHGWMLLARSYRTVGRLGDSAGAYREIIKLKSDDVPALSGLAEVLSEAEGRVTPEAKTIFQKILKSDPKNPEARFFLSKAKIEAGDKRAGLRDLKTLFAETPEGAPWRELVQKEIDKHE